MPDHTFGLLDRSASVDVIPDQTRGSNAFLSGLSAAEAAVFGAHLVPCAGARTYLARLFAGRTQVPLGEEGGLRERSLRGA